MVGCSTNVSGGCEKHGENIIHIYVYIFIVVVVVLHDSKIPKFQRFFATLGWVICAEKRGSCKLGMVVCCILCQRGSTRKLRFGGRYLKKTGILEFCCG
jgi:hypothetical protein